ncbi:thiolase-like protein, partial [Truncatella angustata]
SLILERLDDAVRDNDKVRAIIRNSGMNQDGKMAGISLPNPVAEANLMRLVHLNAGLDLRKRYHHYPRTDSKTMTRDSIEVSTMAEVFCTEIRRVDNVYIGSIRSNIRHLEASSGVAGLLKTIIILKHRMLPLNIKFIKPSPRCNSRSG